jgi:hypothetical protein
MQLLREEVIIADGLRVLAMLDLIEDAVVLILASNEDEERYVLGQEEDLENIGSDVTDLLISAENNWDWDALQWAAEGMLSSEPWNQRI